MDEGTKQCADCGDVKLVEEFWKLYSTKDGLQRVCKKCQTAKNGERVRSGYNRQHYMALRRKVLHAYGDRCVCCGEAEFEFLAIDHIDGGGNQHRKQVGLGGARFLRWLRDNDYPPGFRILCHNCNMARGFSGYCPHEAATDAATAEAMRVRRTDPKTVHRGMTKTCPICGMEFLRPPSAKAVTCSTACMGIRQIRLGLNRGQQNAKSKLSDAQRAEIACRRAAGESAAALASEFGVGTSQIYKVANTVAS